MRAFLVVLVFLTLKIRTDRCLNKYYQSSVKLDVVQSINIHRETR